MLSPDDIQKFKALYKQRFGEEISDAEATRLAQRGLNLYRAVFGPPRPAVAAAEEQPAAS